MRIDQAICDRLGALAKVKAERVEEAIPEIGGGLPVRLPPSFRHLHPSQSPHGGAHVPDTAAEMNRATLGHRNREASQVCGRLPGEGGADNS